MQDLGHGAAGDVGALLGEAGVGQIATGVLAVGHVDVGDDPSTSSGLILILR